MAETSLSSTQPRRLARFSSFVNRAPEGLIKHAVMIVLMVLILFPLFFIFNNALKTRDQYLANQLTLATSPTWDNFTKVFQYPRLLSWFGNSILLTGVSVLLCTLIAVLAAYAFASMQFPGRDTLFNLITPLMVIPPIVMLIPMFVLFQRVGLINNLAGPIIIYTGLMLPFTIFLLRNFFITIPREIREAALLDGCSSFQMVTHIIMPLSRPALVTSMIVNAVWVWNELLIALVFLQTEEQRTLIVGIAASLQKRFNLDVPSLMAGLAVATIPMIILYVVGQNALVRGLVAGFEK
ncbi:MAG TPA: carbohydrate ABC transporter permease [Anaerolineales bacterium]|nr:carbohydrate ABC transporter permease [Anaerolineales bacterium]